ncbi:hypothetical protein ACQPYK_31835 [Streptosporangium sp. CA-135522]
MPYFLGAFCCLAGMAALYGSRHHMRSLERVDADHAFPDAPVAA